MGEAVDAERARRRPPTTSTPNSRACRSTKCAQACWRGWSRSARSTTSCCGVALRLARTTLEGIESPTDRLHRRRLVAARRSRRRQRRVAVDAARRCCGWSKRSSAWCGCSTRTSTARASRWSSAPSTSIPQLHAVQPDRRHLRRRRPPRRRGRHRPDPHALLARHQRRRRRRRRRGPLPARPELDAARLTARIFHAMSDIATVRRSSDRASPRPAPPIRVARRAAARARRALRPPAAHDGRVRQLPQAHRARAPRAGRVGRRRYASATCCRWSTTSSARWPSPSPPEAQGLPRRASS